MDSPLLFIFCLSLRIGSILSLWVRDLSRTDLFSCSRMAIEAFLYLFLYETQQSEKIEDSNQTILLLAALHKLEHQGSDVASGLIYSLKISIRCLKKMELTTLIIAQVFEFRLFNCVTGSRPYSKDRHMLLVAINEMWQLSQIG